MNGLPSVAGLRVLVAANLRRLEAVAPLLRSSGWLLSGYAGQLPLSLLQSVLLARLLGLTSYGVYVAILTVVTTIAQLVVCNVTQFVIREYTSAPEVHDRSRAAAAVKFSYVLEALSAIVVFAGVWLLSDILATYLTDSGANRDLIRIAALILFADLCTVTSQSLLVATRRFRMVSYGYLLQATATLAVALFCFVLDLKSLQLILAGVICGYAFRAILLHLAARGDLHRSLGSSWTSVPLLGQQWPLKRWLVYIAQNNLGDSLTVLTKSGSLWLAFLSGPQPVALYKIAESIGGLVFIGIRALGDASYPGFVRLVNRSDPSALTRHLVRNSVVGAGCTVAVCIALGALSPMLLDVLYGEAYAGALPALLILLLGGALCGAVYWAPGLILAKGRPGLSTSIKVLATLIQVPLMLVLIPPLQHVGAAISISVGRVVLVVWLAIAGFRARASA